MLQQSFAGGVGKICRSGKSQGVWAWAARLTLTSCAISSTRNFSTCFVWMRALVCKGANECKGGAGGYGGRMPNISVWNGVSTWHLRIISICNLSAICRSCRFSPHKRRVAAEKGHCVALLASTLHTARWSGAQQLWCGDENRSSSAHTQSLVRGLVCAPVHVF